MKRMLPWLLICLMGMSAQVAANTQPDNLFPKVRLTTSMGSIVVELDRLKAPLSVENFLKYVTGGLYNQTIFHRVIPGFVVQGGGIDKSMEALPALGPIFNESGNGLSNDQYSIAMARAQDPHSANRQFYFNMNDNDNLNPSTRGWGYAVFGSVIEGEEILEKIALVPTQVDPKLGWPDVPVESVVLIEAKLLPRD